MLFVFCLVFTLILTLIVETFSVGAALVYTFVQHGITEEFDSFALVRKVAGITLLVCGLVCLLFFITFFTVIQLFHFFGIADILII